MAGRPAKQSADKSQNEFLMQSPRGCGMLQRQHWDFLFVCVCVACPFTLSLFCDRFENFLFFFDFSWFCVGLKRCDTACETVLPDIYGWWFVFLSFGLLLLWGCFGLGCLLYYKQNLCFCCSSSEILKCNLPLSPCTSFCRSLPVCLRSPLLSLISYSLFTTPGSVYSHRHFRHMTYWK